MKACSLLQTWLPVKVTGYVINKQSETNKVVCCYSCSEAYKHPGDTLAPNRSARLGLQHSESMRGVRSVLLICSFGVFTYNLV